MTKLIKIPADLTKKVRTICRVFDWDLSDSELKVLVEIIRIGQGGMFSMDVNTSRTIREALGTTENTFNVLLARLVKKHVISNKNRVIQINPAFMGIQGESEYLIRFVTG
jgi:hypothetical protein